MAAVWAGDKFKPLHQVITEEMTQYQRDRMVECLRNVLTNIGIAVDDSSHIFYPCYLLEPTDALALVAAVQGNQALKARLATEMVTFLSRQCNIYVNE